MGGPLLRIPAMRDLFWLPIPGREPHPAIVVYSRPGGKLVLACGTGSPQAELPDFVVDGQQATMMKLKKATGFYTKFVYVWMQPCQLDIICKALPAVYMKARTVVDLALDRDVAGEVRLKTLPPGSIIPLDIFSGLVSVTKET